MRRLSSLASGIVVLALIAACAPPAGEVEPPPPTGQQTAVASATASPTASATESPAAAPTDPPEPTPDGPRHPFPQHVRYSEGAILPDHVSQAELDAAVSRFYEAWKARYLRDDCGEDQVYVFTDGDTNGISVSEGQGYGMIVTALLAGYDPDARALFDGLYRYFKAHPSIIDPYLMAWNQVEGCADVDPGGTASALDGDMDIAYGLLLADAQWGSGGEIDYRGEALQVIDAIMEHEVNPETMTLLLGDWVSAGESEYYYGTRSSDFMFGHLRAFETATGDPRWGEVREATYVLVETIQTQYSPQTGLLPYFIQDVDTSPRPADAGFLEGQYDGAYYYNACRTPLRIGMDYVLSGDERDRAALSRINAWLRNATGEDPAAVHSGYDLDGTSEDNRAKYTDLSFIAPIGVGAMAGPENQAWLNSLWDFVVDSSIDESGYYANSLKLLSLIVMSGNWWGPPDVEGDASLILLSTDARVMG